MSEPASRDDVEAARDVILKRIEDQNTATRAHIGSEVATVRGDVGHMKNYMERLLKAFKRFLTRHGMGSDDL